MQKILQLDPALYRPSRKMKDMKILKKSQQLIWLQTWFSNICTVQSTAKTRSKTSGIGPLLSAYLLYMHICVLPLLKPTSAWHVMHLNSVHSWTIGLLEQNAVLSSCGVMTPPRRVVTKSSQNFAKYENLHISRHFPRKLSQNLAVENISLNSAYDKSKKMIALFTKFVRGAISRNNAILY